MVADHVHHEAAHAWLASQSGERFATCPLTQGALVRLLVRNGVPAADAVAVVARVTADERHDLWPDDLSYADVPVAGVFGHRQVTDVYLAALARAHGGRLATFDQGLSALRPDVVTAIPTSAPPA